MAETAAAEQQSRRQGRFNIPENDGYHYVIAEKPGPNDEGSSSLDHLDDLGYQQVEESRRKVLLRIKDEDYAAIKQADHARSQRIAKTPVAVNDSGGTGNMPGVLSNTMEEMASVPTVDTFLDSPEPRE